MFRARELVTTTTTGTSRSICYYTTTTITTYYYYSVLRHLQVHLLARPLELVGHCLRRVAIDPKETATADGSVHDAIASGGIR